VGNHLTGGGRLSQPSLPTTVGFRGWNSAAGPVILVGKGGHNHAGDDSSQQRAVAGEPVPLQGARDAVYDGDTCTVDIDLGLNTWIRGEKVRLNRINAPEMTGADKPQGTVARDYLRSLVLDQDVILETIKDAREKYGRYLGEVWLAAGGQPQNVNDALVAAGHAKYQSY
jgi:micrococcal nuclease